MAFALALWGCAGCVSSTPVVRMRLVDAATQESVIGAHAVYTAQSYPGSFSGDGGDSSTMFFTEATSDREGWIVFPSQRIPEGLPQNYRPAMVLIFKPGYRATKVANADRSPLDRTLVTTWENNDSAISLEKANNAVENAESLYVAQLVARSAYAVEKERCWWKRIPAYLAAVEAAATQIEKRDNNIARALAVRAWNEGPVSELIRDKDAQVRAGCGDPAAHFKSHIAQMDEPSGEMATDRSIQRVAGYPR
jgi:hypothetical protein